MTSYPHLLSPGRIGSMDVRNRLMQSAMGSNFAHDGGFFGDELIAYLEARAAGGVGLIITEAVSVGYPQGAALSRQVAISHDKYIPGLQRLTDAVHRHGAKIALQLHFAGINAARDMVEGRDVWVPSLPGAPAGTGMQGYLFPEEAAMTQAVQIKHPVRFRVLEQGDIDQLIEWFASGALRARQAGFDAVEIHGGHGYIIAGFLSPAINRRSDGYSGSAENRARLLREVTEAVRARVGPDFPVWCKIDAAEFFIDGGVGIDDVCTYARIAEQAGADAISVTATHDYSVPRAQFSSYLPHQPGKLIPYAAEVKAAVGVPVITVGRIDPEVADRAIAEGKFDFMAMGRKQLADPDYAKNLAAGGKARVRPCIYCYTCLSQAMIAQPLRCSVNGDLGFETENLLAPAKNPRRVVVVGGGPGGMEAARRLTIRGHRAVVLEAGAQLGGTARIAAIAYPPNGDFVEWLKARLEELHVEVRLNMRADADVIRALAPDAVIVATGAIRGAPPIPGGELGHVHHVTRLKDLLAGGWRPGRNLVVIGGEAPGVQLAEAFARDGRTVALVGEEPQFGRGLSPARRSVVLDEMACAGIALHPGASGIAIGETSVGFTTEAGEPHQASADTVILASGAEPNTGLYDELVAAGIEAHMVGDCQGAGFIIGAVRNAADVAARI